MKQLRCAIIGCGRIGCGFDDKTTKTIMTHAGSYFNNSNTKLIALCDIDQKKLKKYGKKYNINNLYTTSDEMFENETIDCVSICTLVDTHLELVTQAVKHGIKAIFLEKPISNSLHTAKKIINICNDNNVILLIDHQRRFDPFFHTLKDLIQTKKLGTIQSINIYYGSGISNTGSHIFDLIRLFFGEAVSVNARYSKNTSSNKLDPNLNIILKFKYSHILMENQFNIKKKPFDKRFNESHYMMEKYPNSICCIIEKAKNCKALKALIRAE